MTEKEWLAQSFEANRAHLEAVAYRMLGSTSEAEDAVQEAWLRFNRAGATGFCAGNNRNLSSPGCCASVWIADAIARSGCHRNSCPP